MKKSEADTSGEKARSGAEVLLRWSFIQLALQTAGIRVEEYGDPPDGQFIAAIAPHTSQIDNIVFLSSLEKRGFDVENIGMLAKQSYWQGWRHPVANFLLGHAYLVSAGNTVGVRQIIRDLKSNPQLVLGSYVTYGRDPEMVKPIEEGFMYLSAVSGVPIVPVALLGVNHVMPPGQFWSTLIKGSARTITFSKTPVEIHWLDSIVPADIGGKTKDKMLSIENQYRRLMIQFFIDQGLVVPGFLLDQAV